jgi:hypothetical protein
MARPTKRLIATDTDVARRRIAIRRAPFSQLPAQPKVTTPPYQSVKNTGPFINLAFHSTANTSTLIVRILDKYLNHLWDMAGVILRSWMRRFPEAHQEKGIFGRVLC